MFRVLKVESEGVWIFRSGDEDWSEERMGASCSMRGVDELGRAGRVRSVALAVGFGVVILSHWEFGS